MDIKIPDLSNSKMDSHIGPEASSLIERIKASLKNIDCNNYFKVKSKKGEERKVVTRLQTDLQSLLNELENTDLWMMEHLASTDHKDRFDLYYEINLDGLTYSVIIELDACRADQIAKKFVSRAAHTIGKPTIYFAFCYPGTKHMPFSECIKYMAYCNSISNGLSSTDAPREFVGALIKKQ